jgi:hypothetical protein
MAKNKKKKPVKEDVVVLRVPDDLMVRVRDLEQNDPEVLESIVRAIFGSQFPRPYFGISRVQIEPQTRTADVEKEKGKERKLRWDKSCL